MTVYEDKVEISSKGFAKFLSQGTRTIQISNISGVEFKEAGFAFGYIRLIVGGNRNDGNSVGGLLGALTSSAQNAANDPNAIMFEKKLNKEAIQIKNIIEGLMSSSKTGTGNIINEASKADELKKFKELLDEGIITEEEFQTKKNQIIGI